MNTRLRKTHLWIWMAWVILLPILFFYAYFNTPIAESQVLIFKNLPEALPIKFKSVEDTQMKISLKTDNKQAFQLEMVLNEPFKSPAPSIWINLNETATFENSAFISNIEGKGLYRFPLEPKVAKQIKEIIFYCNFQKKILKQIKLN